MSLQIWLPLTKDLRQQGLSNATVTNNGATFNSAGKLGGCYSFDGSDDGIRIDGDIIPQLQQNNFSICFWLFSNDAGDRSIYIATTPASDWGFSIEKTTANKLRVYWQSNPDFNSSLDIPDQQWCHIAVVIKDGNCYCYKNGEKLAERTSGDMTPAKLSRTWVYAQLGRDTRTGSTVLKGKMNDFRWYDHALSQMEVKEIAKGLVLHYPLSRQGWGQENLLSRYVVPGQAGPTSTSAGGRTTWLGDYKITIPATENADTYFRLFMSEQLVSGQTYTISCQVSGLLNGTAYRFPMFTQNNSAMGVLDLNHNGLNSLTFTMNWTGTQTTATGANGETVYINLLDDSSRVIASGQGPITVSHFKLEKGDKVTLWCPNSSDTLATTMGLNSTTEYDCSGFGNNGTKNNITYTSDTPKYTVSSIFDGSNSYIKVNDNNWMVKGMLEMTVNLWAKASTWPTTGRLISCTESGGFNLEAGNSGYWRFPIYVYTNSDQTSSAYKYDSKEIRIADLTSNEWNMITLVYNGEGTKTYINGELHHTYTNTSYGINFNTNARLFLGCEANTASPSSPYFNGNECDFRIYTTALSADDIKSLYQNSAYIDSSGNVYGAIHEEV